MFRGHEGTKGGKDGMKRREKKDTQKRKKKKTQINIYSGIQINPIYNRQARQS